MPSIGRELKLRAHIAHILSCVPLSLRFLTGCLFPVKLLSTCSILYA